MHIFFTQTELKKFWDIHSMKFLHSMKLCDYLLNKWWLNQMHIFFTQTELNKSWDIHSMKFLLLKCCCLYIWCLLICSRLAHADILRQNGSPGQKPHTGASYRFSATRGRVRPLHSGGPNARGRRARSSLAMCDRVHERQHGDLCV